VNLNLLNKKDWIKDNKIAKDLNSARNNIENRYKEIQESSVQFFLLAAYKNPSEYGSLT
jgi:hypothetical protein